VEVKSKGKVIAPGVALEALTDLLRQGDQGNLGCVCVCGGGGERGVGGQDRAGLQAMRGWVFDAVHAAATQ
jgi:hypothetical protein